MGLENSLISFQWHVTDHKLLNTEHGLRLTLLTAGQLQVDSNSRYLLIYFSDSAVPMKYL